MANIFQIALAGVGAAPGAFYSEIEEFVGLTDEQTALNVLFDIFNAGADDSEWATALVNNVVGNAVDEASKASLVEEIVSFAAESGLSRGEIASLLVMIVNSLDPAVEPWGAVKTQWDNRLEVAEALNANLGNMTDANDLAALKELIASVTADPATVEAALEKIESGTIGEVVITYTLEASAPATNEGVANFFTVVASQAVEVDTEVTFLLKIADGDTASLADFNAGAFNAVTVKILAGETVSEAFKVEPITNDGTELTETYTVQATVAGQTLTMQASILDGSVGAGQTFQLTTGLDIIPGMNGSNGNAVTSGNDTIIGVLDAANSTLNVTDLIDAGEGTDTLKVVTDGTAVPLGGVSNVEIIQVQSSGDVTVDSSAVAGVTNLNVTKAAGTVAATAAATTDVSVALEENGAGSALAHTIDGGNNVTVTATKQGATANPDTITVGGTTAAAGDVVVNSTGAAYTAATANSTLGDITVTGGKTISVTQKAAADTAAAAADATNATITQGAISVTASADTTTVTIKQDAAVTAANAAFTTGAVTETASAKFSALTAGQTIIMGGLTFTASDDMTAEEAAAAFANLVNGAAYGTPVLVPAGDTQGSGLATKGEYTGVFTGWTSAAASGDTVVFTSTTANSNVADLANTGTGTVTITSTQGKVNDATAAGGKMGVVAGTVTVAADAALKTVTVDGYAGGSAVTGAAAALDTLNLSNGGAFGVAASASTLALNLEGVNGAVTFTAAPSTLNINSIGNNTSAVVAAATTALNVSGTGLLNAATANIGGTKNIKVTETAGLNLTGATLTALESVDTTGTTGTVTVAIKGDQATYTGGAGVDNVTVTNADTAVAKAIDLGAGDDKLTLQGVVVVPTAAINGGAGVDTLSMTAASAAGLGATFAAKVTGFERLELTAATGPQAIDTAALGNYNDVAVDGARAGATTTLNNLASGATLRLTTTTDLDGTNTAAEIIANIKDADKSTTDVLNVIIDASQAYCGVADDHGKLTAANVETINVSVIDTLIQSPINQAPDQQLLLVAADKATAINVTGDTALGLTLDTLTNKVATIDASSASGALTVDLSGHNGVAVTVKGGAGADVLTASVGVNAKADVLDGGAGNDILVAGTNGAKLTGGAGNDLFVLTATAATNGNKEANTYSSITDFAAGDLLKLGYYDGTAEAVVESFAKLGAVLNPNTAVFSDYVNAAIEQANLGDAVWFMFNNNSYVVIDSNVDNAVQTFANGEDLIIELAGVDLTNASFNATHGTVALV